MLELIFCELRYRNIQMSLSVLSQNEKISEMGLFFNLINCLKGQQVFILTFQVKSIYLD